MCWRGRRRGVKKGIFSGRIRGTLRCIELSYYVQNELKLKVLFALS